MTIADLIERDQDRMAFARKTAEQEAVIDLIEQWEADDRARLEARRRETRQERRPK